MKFFRDVALAGLVSVLALAALEGGLRLAQCHYEASLYEPENERGYALRPNSEGWSTSEADVYVRINSDGMRDRERPIARPLHTLRVAVVGSSEVDARQVPLEKTFESVMDGDLSHKIGPLGWHADVLNFGVPGYTYSQEYLTLHNHVWKYEPQIVILLFSAFPVLKTTRAFYPGELKGAPVDVLQDDGELVPDAITRNTPPINPRRLLWKNRLSDWMNRSYLLCLLNIASTKVPSIFEPLLAWGKPSSPKVVGENWVYDPDQPQVRESWAITEAFLKEMKKDCDSHGAEFWLVVADMAIQVHPSLDERVAVQRQMKLSSLDLVDRHLERFGLSQGIPVFALAPPLGKYAAAHDVFLHGPLGSRDNDGHWNEVGHELAGHAIARELVARSQAIGSIDARADRLSGRSRQ